MDLQREHCIRDLDREERMATVKEDDATALSPGKKDAHLSRKKDERDPTYFSYYQQFTHQQNMLQDTVRTSMYWSSILASPGLFKDKCVMDLGAGSGRPFVCLS